MEPGKYVLKLYIRTNLLPDEPPVDFHFEVKDENDIRRLNAVINALQGTYKMEIESEKDIRVREEHDITPAPLLEQLERFLNAADLLDGNVLGYVPPDIVKAEERSIELNVSRKLKCEKCERSAFIISREFERLIMLHDEDDYLDRERVMEMINNCERAVMSKCENTVCSACGGKLIAR